MPVRAKFFPLIQNGTVANPFSCTTGTRSFPGINAAGA